MRFLLVVSVSSSPGCVSTGWASCYESVTMSRPGSG